MIEKKTNKNDDSKIEKESFSTSKMNLNLDWNVIIKIGLIEITTISYIYNFLLESEFNFGINSGSRYAVWINIWEPYVKLKSEILSEGIKQR